MPANIFYFCHSLCSTPLLHQQLISLSSPLPVLRLLPLHLHLHLLHHHPPQFNASLLGPRPPPLINFSKPSAPTRAFSPSTSPNSTSPPPLCAPASASPYTHPSSHRLQPPHPLLCLQSYHTFALPVLGASRVQTTLVAAFVTCGTGTWRTNGPPTTRGSTHRRRRISSSERRTMGTA